MYGKDVGDDGSSDGKGEGGGGSGGDGGGDNLNTIFETGDDVCGAKIRYFFVENSHFTKKKTSRRVPNTETWMRMNKRFAAKSLSALCLLCCVYQDYLFVLKGALMTTYVDDDDYNDEDNDNDNDDADDDKRQRRRQPTTNVDGMK